MNPQQQQGPISIEDIAVNLMRLLPAIDIKCEYLVDVKKVDGDAYKVHRILIDDVEKFKKSEPISEPEKLKEQLLQNKVIRDNQEIEESKVLTILDEIIPASETVDENPS